MGIPAAAPPVSVVLPVLNVGRSRLGDTTARLVGALTAAQHAGELGHASVVLVDDGSSDPGVVREVVALHASRSPDLEVIGLFHDQNRGKGAALRTGMRAGLERVQGGVVGFVDADGDIAPEQVVSFCRALLNPYPGTSSAPTAVVGCKWVFGSTHSDRPLWRRAASVGFAALARFALPVGTPDTQTGIKVFESEALRAALPRCREDRFLFDLELLGVLAHNGAVVRAEPVHLQITAPSNISARTTLHMASGLVRLSWRTRRGRRWPNPEQAP